MSETPKRRGRRPSVEVEAERRLAERRPAGVLTLVVLGTGEVQVVKLPAAELLTVAAAIRAARGGA